VFGLHRIPYVAVAAIEWAFPGISLLDVGPAFDRLRRIKSEIGIALIREAVRVTDAAIDSVKTELRSGESEIELAAKIAYLMNREGAEPAFAPIVMAGTERDDIIRMPSRRQPAPGDRVMIDVGAAVEGYCADVGRTLVLGEPNDIQRKAWDTVRRTHDTLLAMIKPSLPCRLLHDTAANLISDAEFTLRHRIGHGIGLATSFEWPSLDTETAVLEPGMTVAIEPAVYACGARAVKLENDILITATGSHVGRYNASGLLVPDSSLNRVFILGQSSSQSGTGNYTIVSFDQAHFTPVSSVTIQNLVGTPAAIARWGTSGLAIATYNSDPGPTSGPAGMLYILDNPTFVSATQQVQAGVERLAVGLTWQPGRFTVSPSKGIKRSADSVGSVFRPYAKRGTRDPKDRQERSPKLP
jgi:Xaa-Pro aminopeptidase